MKKIKTVAEWGIVAVAVLRAITTLLNERHVHISHGEHLPCDCESSCLSCLGS